MSFSSLKSNKASVFQALQKQLEKSTQVGTVDERFWLHDMGYLYDRSFNELEKLFRSKFKKSKVFQDMILELYESNIEYKFL